MQISERQKNSSSGTKKSLPPLKKAPRISITFFSLLCLLALSWIYSSYTTSYPSTRTIARKKKQKKIEYAADCFSGNGTTRTCSSNYPITCDDTLSNATCPDYFRWIHEDLKPFMSTGISRDMVEGAKKYSNFRLVIKKGKVYVERYNDPIQTRDWYTIWGIIQLLRRYPGRLPDLELMFDCKDLPEAEKRWFDFEGPNAAPLPPFFRYCGDQLSQNVLFPDWSFWGCALFDLKPWEIILKELEERNKRIKWMDRKPYAFWKGNVNTSKKRINLLYCNVSKNGDWNARIFRKDWLVETRRGIRQSNLSSHCNYRYNIYIEGFTWSISAKYILACDSPTLLINTSYFDFFMRSLQPLQHYWPVRDDDKCRSIKFAVDWGNNNKEKAQGIGKAASSFIKEDLKMDFVYDYMFHLLNEYAKLLRFEPKVPKGAIELCPETMACYVDVLDYKILRESLVKSPSIKSPCTLPSRYDPRVLEVFMRRKADSTKLVEEWERNF